MTHAAGVRLVQKLGHVTALSVGEIPVQRRAGKGEMLASVLLDDVVVSASATAAE